MRRKLLMVYPRAFGYGWSGETPRLMHVSQGLARFGWEVTLLRCRQPNEAKLKPVVAAFPGGVCTAPFYGPYPGLLNRKGLRRLFNLWRGLLGIAGDDDAAETVAKRMLRFVKRSPVPRPDMIFGVTVGSLSGPLCAQKLSTYFQCPFVIEFRDPVPHPGDAPLSPHEKSVWEACLRDSALVIATTQGISRRVAEDFPVVQNKGRTIYSCYDDVPPQASGNAKPDVLVLAHAGVLYGGRGRNARSLVQAIAEVVKRDASAQGRIILRLIGGRRGGIEAAELAGKLGIPWAVELLPQLPARICLDQMDRADILVAIKFDDAEYDLQVPGKILQYLGRGKPILGLMRETEAAEILRRSGLGRVVANSDVNGIAAALLEFWNQRDALPTRFQPDWGYIRQFSASAMAQTIDRELTAVLGGNKAGLKTESSLVSHTSQSDVYD